MKEIEILVRVEEAKDAALEKLQSFHFEGIVTIHDTYFVDPLRDDLKQEKDGRLTAVFRVREKGEQTFLTYKKDQFDDDEKWLFAEEHETTIGNKHELETILTHLGFVEHIMINNERHVFTVDDYEIVLEDVKDLGLFLEVELRKEVPDGEEHAAREELQTFIDSLDIAVSEELNEGKPAMMLKKRKEF